MLRIVERIEETLFDELRGLFSFASLEPHIYIRTTLVYCEDNHTCTET